MQKPLKSIHTIALFFLCVLLLLSVLFFCSNYYFQTTYHDSLFFVNFYFFYGIFCTSLVATFCTKEVISQNIFLIIALISGCFFGYQIDSLFTVKIFAYSAFVFASGITAKNLKRLQLTLLGISCFALMQYHFSFFGLPNSYLKSLEPSALYIFSFTFLLLTFTVAVYVVRFLYLKSTKEKAVIEHLNLIMTQMSQFNQSLQENIYTSEEKASTEERLRITREIHDSAGYVFVNIIALMDAVMSKGDGMHEEIFQVIRKQASEGLQETRRILRELRSIDYVQLSTVEAIYKLKSIFEEVTTISVNLDTGNMQKEYSKNITDTIIRTMQECFTNAIRHGKATKIQLYFWEKAGELFLVVSDNGIGADHVVKGIGLAGMEERVKELQGNLQFTSAKDGGFRLYVTLPLQNETEQGE